jgi:hypothetical protein
MIRKVLRVACAIFFLVLAACSTEGPLSTTNSFVAGKAPPAAEIQRVLAAGVPVTTKAATDWCTSDPLPAKPYPSNFTVRPVSPPDAPPVIGERQEANIWFPEPNLPKRVWCLVKNQGDPAFTQCPQGTHCVYGDYFYITVRNGGPPSPTYWWINFWNEHSGKTRVIEVVSEY